VAKHLPDLGHDVKDLKVFSWTLRGWKKLEKKLTSEEFECGGHRWCVASIFASRTDIEPTIFRIPFITGVYYSFHSVTLMRLRTTLCLSISTTLIQRRHLRAGMLVLSLLW